MRMGTDILIGLKELQNFGVSYNYAKKKVSQNREGLKPTWKSMKKGHTRLVSYDSLPGEQKNKLPAKAELIQLIEKEEALEAVGNRATLLSSIRVLIENRYRDILDYHILKEKGISDQKAMDLTIASGLLRFIQAYPTKTKTRELGIATNRELQQLVLEYLSDLKNELNRELYGFRVNNLRILQERVRKWKAAFSFAFENSTEKTLQVKERQANKAAVLSLIPGHFGNDRARKVGKISTTNPVLIAGGRIDLTEYHASKLLLLFMNPGSGQKFDFENIYLRYQQLCSEDGKQPVSMSSVKNFLKNQEVRKYTIWERDGWAQHDKQLPYVRGQRPEFALQKGGYDGFQVDFKTYVKSEEKLFMLTVVFVADYYSEAITGFDIGLVENGRMVRNMYRNHLNTHGYQSYIEIESDRFSGNLSADTRSVFEKCCRYINQSTPNDPQGKAPNPKSRFVERLVAEVNRLAQNTRGWKGTNITSIDKQRKPNPDYAEYVNSLEAGIQEIIQLINIYNNKELPKYNGLSRISKFRNNIHPAALTIPVLSAAQLLNQHTIATVRNEIVKIRLSGKVYEYDFPDAFEQTYRMAPGRKVRVYFDENDLEEVDVFGFSEPANPEADVYLATLEKLKRVRRDKDGQRASDLEEISHITKRRTVINQDVSRKLLEVQAAEFGLESADYPIEHLKKLVAGARYQHDQTIIRPADRVYHKELATQEAISSESYYQKRLITDLGLKVPQSPGEPGKSDDSKRQYIERRRNRRKDQE